MSFTIGNEWSYTRRDDLDEYFAVDTEVVGGCGVHEEAGDNFDGAIFGFVDFAGVVSTAYERVLVENFVRRNERHESRIEPERPVKYGCDGSTLQVVWLPGF